MESVSYTHLDVYKRQAFTVFKKGVYPTKDDAERAIYAGALFVYEENGTIAVSYTHLDVYKRQLRTRIFSWKTGQNVQKCKE